MALTVDGIAVGHCQVTKITAVLVGMIVSAEVDCTLVDCTFSAHT